MPVIVMTFPGYAVTDDSAKVINSSEATLHGDGRALGETLKVLEDGSLLRAGMVLVMQ